MKNVLIFGSIAHNAERAAEWDAQMEEAKKEAEEVCFTCKKPMDATEHNYGTEDMLCCIHCYQFAQEDGEI